MKLPRWKISMILSMVAELSTRAGCIGEHLPNFNMKLEIQGSFGKSYPCMTAKLTPVPGKLVPVASLPNQPHLP